MLVRQGYHYGPAPMSEKTQAAAAVCLSPAARAGSRDLAMAKMAA